MMMMVVDNLTEDVVSSELLVMSMNVTQLNNTRNAISTLQQTVDDLHRYYTYVCISSRLSVVY